jgi:aminoglycoside/choline kinase family phosphotransferase
MVHAGALYWIDFQDARMGPATYDLVSLVRDSYVELPPGLAAALVEEFRQRAVPRESKDVFERRFDLMAVQRNLKALGTFGYMATVRRNSVYLQHVPRTLGYLRTNLARHPDLGALRRVLARHLEELR